jgi:hypothetical protein
MAVWTRVVQEGGFVLCERVCNGGNDGGKALKWALIGPFKNSNM